jgi:hypothetical protein
LSAIEIAELDEGPAERDTGREITGMKGEADAARIHRVLMLAGTPVFLGELRKGNRRRVLLDPPTKVFDLRVVGHGLRLHGDGSYCRSADAGVVDNGQLHHVRSRVRVVVVLKRRGSGHRLTVTPAPDVLHDRSARDGL